MAREISVVEVPSRYQLGLKRIVFCSGVCSMWRYFLCFISRLVQWVKWVAAVWPFIRKAAFPKIEWKHDGIEIQMLTRKELRGDTKPALKSLRPVMSSSVFGSLGSRAE